MNLEQLDRHLAEQIESRRPYDGIAAMAKHATARQSVWWGCSCGWFLWRPIPAVADDASLGIVSRWVFEGDDEYRRFAATRAELPEAGCCKWLLKAVVNSGGRLEIPDRPAAQPTPDIAGKLVEGFLHQLLAKAPPVKRMETAQTFVAIARQTLAEPLPTFPANASGPASASPSVPANVAAAGPMTPIPTEA